MDVNALQKLGTGGVGEASKGNLAHPEAYLPLDAQPYLSMLDYQIICDQGSGSVHSKEYDCLSRSSDTSESGRTENTALIVTD